MADSLGNQRLCFLRVAAYLADNPEQLLINCAAGKNSPVTIASYDDLESDTPLPLRDREWILGKIRQVCSTVDPSDILKYQEAAREEGLNGVHEPFWEVLPGYRPELCCAPDILHGLLRFWRDHILKWTIKLVGEKELDARLRVLQPIVGIRQFSKGISHLSQWSGREDRELQRVLLAVTAGAPKMESRVVQCLRAFHDFLYLAQYRTHSDSTLKYLSAALAKFHELKHVFIENGARKGKKKKMDHFKIPKLAVLHSYAHHIPWMGTSPQFSTEVTETCHQYLVKEPYRLTNFRDYEKQMCRSLDRDERIQQMDEFLRWFEEESSRAAIEAELEGHSQEYRQLALQHIYQTDGREVSTSSNDPKINETKIFCTQTPHSPRIPILDVAKQYKLIDLPLRVNEFLKEHDRRGSEHLNPAIDVWTRFRMQTPTVQDSEELSQIRTIQALPPSEDMRYGLGNCVLVRDTPDTGPDMIKGTMKPLLLVVDSFQSSLGHRVAQVRLVFRLQFASRHPMHLVPLAYVQWFSKPRRVAEQDIDMYEVKRLRDDGRHCGSVVKLSSIARLVQLIPRFGASVPPEMNVHNSTELCKVFYVNSFMDKEVYRAVY